MLAVIFNFYFYSTSLFIIISFYLNYIILRDSNQETATCWKRTRAHSFKKAALAWPLNGYILPRAEFLFTFRVKNPLKNAGACSPGG